MDEKIIKLYRLGMNIKQISDRTGLRMEYISKVLIKNKELKLTKGDSNYLRMQHSFGSLPRNRD